MITKYFIQNYGDIEDYLELFDDSVEFIFKENGLNGEINIKPIDKILKLSEKDLSELCFGRKLKKKGLNYINHCGFTYQSFGEISISVFHPKYTFFDNMEEWIAEPLRFKIDKKTFEIGSASPLFVLLNEPIYRDSDWQFEFQNFATIKVINTDEQNIKDDIIKALYYLNSHYLKSIGFVARVYHMEVDGNDPLNLLENDIHDIFQKVNRVRTSSRDNFISTEPLILYNQAQSIKGDEKFLYLYRILEFFMQRAKIQKVNELRYNTDISDSTLLQTIDMRNEEMQLGNILKETLTASQKKKISKFAFYKKLITEDNFNYITKALYKFRNSMVHAKENQINDIKMPDTFEYNSEVHPWIYLIDEITIKCIRKYNKASG